MNAEKLKDLSSGLKELSKKIDHKLSYLERSEALRCLHLKLLTLPKSESSSDATLKALNLCQSLNQIFNSEQTFEEQGCVIYVSDVEQAKLIENWTKSRYDVSFSLSTPDFSIRMNNAVVKKDSYNQWEFNNFDGVTFNELPLKSYLLDDQVAIDIFNEFAREQILKNLIDYGMNVSNDPIGLDDKTLNTLLRTIS